jgi:uncharacterized metal-binding protein YceD (DUF177 family)
MTEPTKPRLRLAALSKRAPTPFELVPGPDALAGIRERLGLLGLRKVRLAGTLAPAGASDWHLEAALGATIVQPCAVTLEPVTTRIEEPVERRYLAEWTVPDEAEAEMPEDDSAEPLPDWVDLNAVLEETLALALPAFPRAPGAELGEIEARPPGAAPLAADDRENPFAVLERLKKGPGGG